MSTPNAVETKDVRKSGVSLETFDEVKLYKPVKTIAEIGSMDDAKSRVNGDEKRLLEAMQIGLQEIEMREARKSEEGWFLFDSEGKKTQVHAAGSLISPEIWNPQVLQMANNLETTVKRNGQEVVINWSQCETPEEKNACKANAAQAIKQIPQLIAGMKRRQAMLDKEQSGE